MLKPIKAGKARAHYRGPLAERFWLSVLKTEGCWNWTGSFQKSGYGKVTCPEGKNLPAHRVSLELSGIELPYGVRVGRTCENRACVNPGHLTVSARGGKAPDEVRFWRAVEKTDGCWLWTLKVNKTGYGCLKWDGKLQLAHRVSVTLGGREIPTGMYVDHMCRNRKCVRPDHLRVVTPRVNALENSVGPAARAAAKTHCIRGHELSGDNLVAGPKTGRKRICLACTRLRRQPKEKR